MSNVLTTLPKEVLQEMLTFLPLNELMVLRNVNRVLREMCDAEIRLQRRKEERRQFIMNERLRIFNERVLRRELREAAEIRQRQLDAYVSRGGNTNVPDLEDRLQATLIRQHGVVDDESLYENLDAEINPVLFSFRKPKKSVKKN